MQDLRVLLVQSALTWESPVENHANFAAQIAAVLNGPGEIDLIVLPEMFSTGFSMNSGGIAEQVDGPTFQWMQIVAQQYNCAVAGSVATRLGDGVVNRLWFVTPEGSSHYDKRHLFRMGTEHEHYRPGSERVIVHWRDWRIKLEVCYDLRFPVFSRNRGDYDMLLYVANWPAKRAAHWRALLAARAIENQACVVGVNRIGSDGSNIDYAGDSLAIDATGVIQADLKALATCEKIAFDASALKTYREKFPAHLDSDEFELNIR